MFRFARFRTSFLFAAVEPGAAPPPAAPPAEPVSAPANPGAGHPPGFHDAEAAARARIDAALPQGTPPGAPAPEAPPADAPAAPDIWSDAFDDAMIPDGMPYRDAVGLRNEVKQAREAFRPFRDAFGGLDDAGRQAVLSAAPDLGSDLPFIASAMGALHPEDRAYMTRALEMMATDPVQGAQMLSDAADVLRGAAGGAPGGAPPAAPGAPVDPAAWQDPNALAPPPADPAAAPLTRADLEQWAQDRDYQRDVATSEERILARSKELGYDPDSTDPLVRNRFLSFIGLAGQPELAGDLDRAHEMMQQGDQAVIDGFVQAKAADADRPGAPETGAAPTAPVVLETTADAHAAMLGRLDANLGPDPRRRGPD